jgi:hypothetical protein
MRTAIAAASTCAALAGLWPSDHSDRAIALASGECVLYMAADTGSKAGRSTRGLAELRPTTLDDRSPRTGEQAFLPPDLTALYGWTNANLAAVGAPICSGPLNPAPDSREPVYPGILLLAWSLGVSDWHQQPVGAQVPTISSFSNVRTREPLQTMVAAWASSCRGAMDAATLGRGANGAWWVTGEEHSRCARESHHALDQGVEADEAEHNGAS